MILSETLKQFIYKYNNTIIIESNEINTIFNEIESIRSNSTLVGYIFRPGFASSIRFKDYTNADYMAIYAQWSISFGWSDIYENITGNPAQELLENYLKDSNNENISPLITEEKTPIIKRIDYVKTLAKDLAKSKSVLTSHQKDILNNVPTNILKEVYLNSKITIRENRVLLVSKILEKDIAFNPFINTSDIIPILIENFSVKTLSRQSLNDCQISIKDIYDVKNEDIRSKELVEKELNAQSGFLKESSEGTYEVGKPISSYSTKALNKEILSTIKIKLPTSMKRKVLLTLEKNFYNIDMKSNFKKYQGFWKKVLKQILIKNSFEKTVKQYPLFKDIHEIIYSNIETERTIIEKLKKDGLLEEAFKFEMNNAGSLFRNILFYLRNEVGMSYPKKDKNTIVLDYEEPMNNIELLNVFQTIGIKGSKGNALKSVVKTDINKLLKSELFKKFLLGVNPKLLLQVKALLQDEKYYKDCNFKVYNVKVNYKTPIPAIKKEKGEFVIKLIDEAYAIIKKEDNKKLGKVFISDKLKKMKVNFSGRLDVSTNTSGKFLPIGSEIKIPKLLEEDIILRYGVSWKSPEDNKSLSICIDPSVNIINGEYKNKVINWENDTLYNNRNIVVSSSGDISQCIFDEYSTELIDIDVDIMRKTKSTKMFTTVINYDAPQGALGEVETHIFLNIINRKDRVLDGRIVEISLDKMDYSYQINGNSQAEIGLMIDLETGIIEVLKFEKKI